jgi:hypothetical protein
VLLDASGSRRVARQSGSFALRPDSLATRRAGTAVKLPPELDERFFVGQFDYAAEDDYLAQLPR